MKLSIKNSSNILIGLLLVLILQMPLLAKVKLASLFKDDMVLQREDSVPIWGWANPKEEITIHVGWSDKIYNATAKQDGSWKVFVNTPKAGGPYTIKINNLTIGGVLIGEVWLCSGQSNMVLPVAKSNDAEKEIAKADYPNIRLFYVAREVASEPNKTCYGKWSPIQPETVPNMSAAAYYFGRKLYKELNVPIGLVLSAWGGTPAEAWTSEEALEKVPELGFYLERFRKLVENSEPGNSPRIYRSPSSLYNGMIAPLIPYAIRGAIWYQGESNVNDAHLYQKLFSTMIKDWRGKWQRGNFPFYFVQIAPYIYDTPITGALLRDEQRKTLALPNTGMVVIHDIGNINDIHPKNKQEVGRRLALWALAKDYGYKDLVCSGPLYSEMKIINNKIQVEFDYTGSGLTVHGEKLNCFQIAGENRKFYPADAEIVNDKVLVSNPDIKNPVAVRFAFNNTDEPNLFNKEGLPASTFRTDNWPIITTTPNFATYFDKEKKSLFLKLSNDEGYKIYYTLDGSAPDITSFVYKTPIEINDKVTVKACNYFNKTMSQNIAKHKVEKHLANGKVIRVEFPASNMYAANGKNSLIDGVFGSTLYSDGVWLGYPKADLVAIIDLESVQPVHTISTTYLQNLNVKIFFPRSVEYQISEDGENFKTLKTFGNISDKRYDPVIKEIKLDNLNESARYIRVIAKNVQVCPDWHRYSGANAWLFVDEILIK